ncbi:hypothetical protein [Nocardia abscessus]|uniref:hypothetical protein n=1 Tax=Nocardia abscessus TaxID=120957 RepID=UPI0024568ECD|nr:hypothetical protein [Nocardia abscessus]
MDSKRTGRKVVDPGRFDPDTPKRRTSQQSHQWLLARIQTPVGRERALTLRTAAATVALAEPRPLPSVARPIGDMT